MRGFDRIIRIRTPQRIAEDFQPTAEFLLTAWPEVSNDNERKEL